MVSSKKNRYPIHKSEPPRRSIRAYILQHDLTFPYLFEAVIGNYRFGFIAYECTHKLGIEEFLERGTFLKVKMNFERGSNTFNAMCICPLCFWGMKVSK